MATTASLPGASAQRPRARMALLTDGQQALAMRLALIRKARYGILAQYYSWEEDASGKLLLGALIQAARRGIKVRLLVDDLFSGANRYLESLAAEPNIQVRVFNPFWTRLARPWLWPLEVLLDFRRLNQRMHNKLLVVDDEWALVGGRNIGNGYFDLPATHRFVDLDVVLHGDICQDLARGFLRYWRGQWSQVCRQLSWWPIPDSLARVNNGFLLGLMEPASAAIFGLDPALFRGELETLRWHAGSARMVLDHPVKMRRPRQQPTQASRALLAQALQTRQELMVVSPYLVPTRPLYRALHRLWRGGRQVTMLTNSLASTDMPLAHAGYRHRRQRLLARGARLFELRPIGQRCLHAKLALFDETRLLVGSMNLDPRSCYLNTEIGVLLDSKGLVAEVRSWLTTLLAEDSSWRLSLQAQRVHWPQSRTEPATGWWRRQWISWVARMPVHGLL